MEPSYYPMMHVYGVEIPTRCFIGGLPYSMTELELNTFFSQFGVVKDSKIITDRNGISKGYGFVTYETEQEAAGVCARGSLYYKEKKLNISKAIRRQGGQYSKANQEYVNGQRMLYQSSEGYLLAQQNGSWVVEEPSPYCQPAKPCFQLVSPSPMFVGGPTATTTYLQSPITPTYYPAMPAPPPLAPCDLLPPPPDPGPLLYCETAPLVAPPLPPPPLHSHPPRPPPAPQQIVSNRHTVNSTCPAPDSTSSPQKELSSAATEPDQPREGEGGDRVDSPQATSRKDSQITSHAGTPSTASVNSVALNLDKCTLELETQTVDRPPQSERREGERETGQREADKENTPAQRPRKARPPSLPLTQQQSTS